MAHAEGDYEYQTERMQDMDPDLRREVEEDYERVRNRKQQWSDHHDEEEDEQEEQRGDHHDEEEDEQEEETSDMDIVSDSDSDGY